MPAARAAGLPSYKHAAVEAHRLGAGGRCVRQRCCQAQCVCQKMCGEVKRQQQPEEDESKGTAACRTGGTAQLQAGWGMRKNAEKLPATLCGSSERQMLPFPTLGTSAGTEQAHLSGDEPGQMPPPAYHRRKKP